MKTKITIIILFFVLVFIQYRLWFTKNGLLAIFHLHRAIATQMEKNNGLRQENDNLLDEISELRSGGNAVENHARKDLGMIKHGEVFYRTVGDRKDEVKSGYWTSAATR